MTRPLTSLAMLGGLAALPLSSCRPDDSKVIAQQLAVEVEACRKNSDILARESAGDEIVANEKFKKYGGALYFSFAREHDRVRHEAKDYREARAETRLFFVRWDADSKRIDALSRADLQTLFDQVRPLLNRYGETQTFGPRLAEVHKILATRIETFRNP